MNYKLRFLYSKEKAQQISLYWNIEHMFTDFFYVSIVKFSIFQ